MLFKQDLETYPYKSLLQLQRYFGLPPVEKKSDLIWSLAVHQAQINKRGTMDSDFDDEPYYPTEDDVYYDSRDDDEEEVYDEEYERWQQDWEDYYKNNPDIEERQLEQEYGHPVTLGEPLRWPLFPDQGVFPGYEVEDDDKDNDFDDGDGKEEVEDDDGKEEVEDGDDEEDNDFDDGEDEEDDGEERIEEFFKGLPDVVKGFRANLPQGDDGKEEANDSEDDVWADYEDSEDEYEYHTEEYVGPEELAPEDAWGVIVDEIGEPDRRDNLVAVFMCTTHPSEKNKDMVYIEVSKKDTVLSKPCICAAGPDASGYCEWEFLGYAYYIKEHGEWELEYKIKYYNTEEEYQDGIHYLSYVDPRHTYNRAEICEAVAVKSAAKR